MGSKLNAAAPILTPTLSLKARERSACGAALSWCMSFFHHCVARSRRIPAGHIPYCFLCVLCAPLRLCVGFTGVETEGSRLPAETYFNRANRCRAFSAASVCG